MNHITNKQMHYLATHPHAHAKFLMTGRVPREITLSSPLIDLLESLHPRERQSIRGVRLSPALGYQSRQQFHNAEQLYRWIKPAPRVLESTPVPAESVRIKRFHRKLTLNDLRKQSASWPDTLPCA